MDEVSKRRWAKADKPSAFNPRTALEAALDRYEGMEHKPDHIIVLFGRNMEDGSDGTTFFQAGSYSHHGQMGLIVEGMHMVRESAS